MNFVGRGRFWLPETVLQESPSVWSQGSPSVSGAPSPREQATGPGMGIIPRV